MELRQLPVFQILIEKLDTCITEAVAAGLDETALLLRIVKLDLLVRANGVEEDEIDSLLNQLGTRNTEPGKKSEACDLLMRGQPDAFGG